MSNEFTQPAILVDDPTAFQKMLKAFKGQTCLAIDTESNSLYAYTEQVCLIQISIPDVDYLLDTLAGIDISALESFFADTRVEKIFHAAEYDIICLRRDFGFEIKNLFDTMQAARILGIEKLGLANLLGDLYGIDHPKGLQKADWSKRPLTQEMRKYARMDTHYLMQLRGTLGAMLKEKNLLDIAKEDFERLCKSEANNKSKDLYTQVSGYYKLDPRTLRILAELAIYRDGLAKKLNRPHFKVMGNGVLLAVASAQPRTNQELKRTENVPVKIMERYEEGLLAAVKRGLSKAPIHLEKNKRPAQGYIDRVDALQDWRKKMAKKMKVQSDIILPRDVLEQIAANRPRNLNDLEPLMNSIPRRFDQFGSEIVMVIAKGKAS